MFKCNKIIYCLHDYEFDEFKKCFDKINLDEEEIQALLKDEFITRMMCDYHYEYIIDNINIKHFKELIDSIYIHKINLNNLKKRKELVESIMLINKLEDR